jgi:hypothetical protein
MAAINPVGAPAAKPQQASVDAQFNRIMGLLKADKSKAVSEIGWVLRGKSNAQFSDEQVMKMTQGLLTVYKGTSNTALRSSIEGVFASNEKAGKLPAAVNSMLKAMAPNSTPKKTTEAIVADLKTMIGMGDKAAKPVLDAMDASMKSMKAANTRGYLNSWWQVMDVFHEAVPDKQGYQKRSPEVQQKLKTIAENVYQQGGLNAGGFASHTLNAWGFEKYPKNPD